MNRQKNLLLMYFVLLIAAFGAIRSTPAIILQLDDADSDEYFRLNISGVNLEDSIANPNASIEVGGFEYFNGASSIFNDVAMTNQSLSQDWMGMDSFSSGEEHERWAIGFQGNDHFRNSFSWNTLYGCVFGELGPNSRWLDLLGSEVDGHQGSWFVGGSTIDVHLNADYPNAGDSAWIVTDPSTPEPSIVLNLDDPDSDEYFRLNISGVSLANSIANPYASIEVGGFEYFNGASSIFNDVAMTNQSLSQDWMGMDSCSSGEEHERWEIGFQGNDHFRNSFSWNTLYGDSEGAAFSRWSDLLGSEVDGHQGSWFVGGSTIDVHLNADYPNAGDSAWRVNGVPEPSSILLLLTSLAAVPLRVRCG